MTTPLLALVPQDGFDPLTWMGVLVGLALLPFALTMVTSFAKLVVVGGILRQALGTPQIPPTSVLTGLALILSVHIMSPVLVEAWTTFREEESALTETTDGEARGELAYERLRLGLGATEEPLRRFLALHASDSNEELFRGLRRRLEGERPLATGEPAVDRGLELFTVLVPAFVLTELTEAFQIGFLIFVPFLVIDLVVSNLLLAMGMHMLSPVTVSLPLKLLLFVLVDGWNLILQGVVLGYVR